MVRLMLIYPDFPFRMFAKAGIIGVIKKAPSHFLARLPRCSPWESVIIDETSTAVLTADHQRRQLGVRVLRLWAINNETSNLSAAMG